MTTTPEPSRPLEGVRVVEVAEYTFAPAAGAILADWGASVIKIEHAVRGDAQRGVRRGTAAPMAGSFHPLMENANRGKRSVGLALEVPQARPVIHELLRRADVFVTNLRPRARGRLGLDVDDVRSVNPDVVYVRATAYGPVGPDADLGGYDRSAFWARGGSAMSATPSDSPRVIDQPAGAYGDNIGAMTIAGGVAAALYARERGSRPPIVDVSLLGAATWTMALGVDNSLLTGEVPEVPPLSAGGGVAGNPIVGYFRTSDDRWINLMMLQPGRYWADTCRHLGLGDLATDPRFDTAEKVMARSAEASALISEAIAARPYAYWRERLATLEGPWAPVQNTLDLGMDPQVRANGYIRPVVDREGNARELVVNPVQFAGTPPDVVRAPQFAEHTDDVLAELGYSDDEIIQLKIDGAVT
jgi:crotonobetainyl-CoA:carnitine CoA-transferase CaiB-like acyl-CoA transferase